MAQGVGFGSAALVGRKDELDLLRAAAMRADGGATTTVIVLGEAGVGKTRLVGELTTELEAQGALVLVSHGVDLAGGELPFGGVAELVRGVARGVGVDGVRRAAGRAHAGVLGSFDPRLGGAASGAPDRPAVTAALLSLVESLAEARLVVWVLDDLPWLDLVSRDLVSYLARVATGRLLFVATVRTSAAAPDELPDEQAELARVPGATLVPLAPLDAAAVAEQVSALTGGRADAREVARIRGLSDGLPFFVEQLVATGGASGSLRRLVVGGTRGLSDDGRVLLRVAALGEGLLEVGLLRRASALESSCFDAALGEVRDRGLLLLDRDRETLRFRHALLREAVESELLAAERNELHRRWAVTLDAVDPGAHPASAVVMERARHWYGAGDRAAAFTPVLRAAQLVESVPDFALQARWWGRVLELWSDHPGASGPDSRRPAEREGVARDWAVQVYGMALSMMGEWEHCVRVFEAELEGETDWVRSIWLQTRRRHGLSLLSGAFSPTVPPQELDEVVARLSAQTGDFRVDPALHLLLHECEGDRPDLYLPLVTQLRERAQAADDVAHIQLALRHQSWFTLETGDPDGALDVARRSRAMMLERDASALPEADADLVWALVESGRSREAAAHAEQWLRETPDPRTVLNSYARLVAGYLAGLQHLGRWDDLREIADDPLLAVRVYRATADLCTLQVDARRGDGDAAEQRYRQLPMVANPHVVGDMEALAARAWAALELSTFFSLPGDSWEPIDTWRASVPAAKTFLSSWGAAAAASRAASLGRLSEPDADRAHQLAAQLVTELPGGGVIGSTTRAEVAAHAARRAGSDTADQWAETAVAWDELARPYDVAWCRLFEGECRDRDGDRRGARGPLTEALALCDQLGAQPLGDQVITAARRARIEVRGRPSAPSPTGLTTREGEVLVLLACGRTNAQIAADLYMSPKTASVHVSRIIAKLGVANRTEAAAFAHRHGLAGN